MKKSAWLLVAICCVACLWSSSAFAVGVGFYVEGSGGSGEAEWASDTVAWNIDTSGAAVGFVLDTAPANQSNFNYRLNVGFGSQSWEDEDGYTMDAGGIYVENIFGFALKKSENFRWWLGPLVRVGFYSGETDTPVKIDINYAEFGVGAVTGMNFNIKNKVTLAPSIGVRFSGFAGTGDAGGVEEDIEGNTTTGFANLAVLF